MKIFRLIRPFCYFYVRTTVNAAGNRLIELELKINRLKMRPAKKADRKRDLHGCCSVIVSFTQCTF